MRMMRIWLAMLLLSVPALALAQMNQLPAQPHLLVKGQGERTVMPDRFTVVLNLQSVNLDPDLARRTVQGNVEQLLGALKRHRVLKDTLYASSFSVSPVNEYRDRRQVFIGNRVGRQIRGTFAALADLQGLLADVKASEDVQIAELVPGYSKEPELRAELKREAVRQTRGTAAALADAYGTRITGLYSISDVAPSFSYGVQAGTWPSRPVSVHGGIWEPPAPPAPVADGGARVDSLETGTLTFTENVYAIFLIAP